MIDIKTHDFKANYTTEEVDRALELSKTKLPILLSKEPARASGPFAAACMAYYLGRVPDALELIDVSCDCAAARFAAVSVELGTIVAFPFRGQMLSGPSGKPGYGSGPGTWISDLLLAIARRREDVVDIMRDVPLALFAHAPGERDVCFTHWAAALQLFLADEECQTELAKAEFSSRPESLKVATPAIVNRYRVIGPTLEAINEQDQAKFDAHLKVSVEAFKKLFGRGKNATEATSLIDPISAGLAVLGESRGLAIGVCSGYMPEWLTCKAGA